MHDSILALERKLRSYGAVPLTHGTLCSILAGYRSPNDKIAGLIRDGLLQPVKRGMYVVSPEVTGIPVSHSLVANLLYGPSYVSMDYALRHYGLIPERVVAVTSMTTGRGKRFDLPVGRYSYTRSPSVLYPLAIDMIENPDGTCFLMASPEKALCDRLLFTRNLRVRTVRAMRELLFEDMRIDEQALVGLKPGIVRACMAAGLKPGMLEALLKVLAEIQGERN